MKNLIDCKRLLPFMVMLVVFSILLLVSSQGNAQAKKPWVAPESASKMKNPLTVDSSVLADAKKLYQMNCTPCHGKKGKGNGASAFTLNTKPADHTSEGVQQDSDGALFWKLSEGNHPMPTHKIVLTDTQRWELVAYIRTLKKK